MRSKYFLGITFVVFLFIVYYFKSSTNASYEYTPEESEEPEEYIPTAFDTLILSYDSLISPKIDSSGSVGAALAITHKGKIAFLKCYGVRKAGENDPVDENTVFRLASVSKTITGVLAGILAEEDIIDLDDKVVDYLPDFRLRNPSSTNNLSIRNLLSHTSGLVPHAYDNLVEAGIPMRTILDSLYRVNISGLPGQLYGYQNVMFSLYDTITSIKTSKSFSELLKEKIFLPFGMENASAGFEPFSENMNIAYPHAGYGGKYRTLPLNDRYYNTIPAAGINASISDLAKFLIALSGDGSPYDMDTVANLVFSPQVLSPLRRNYLRKWGKVDSKHYGIGWRIIGYKNRKVAYHGGYVQGYRADIALCRKEDIGIVYLTNSPNSVASYAVPAFLKMYFEDYQSD